MVQLAILLWLASAPIGIEPAAQGEMTSELAVADPCAEARRIVAQRPCLRAEDCGAYQGWKSLFGTPGTEPLQPRLATTSAPGTVEIPPSYNCPAGQ